MSAQQLDLARWSVGPVASAGEGHQGFNAAAPLGGEDTGSTVQEGKVCVYNEGIGDAGSTADFRMLWSAMVCLGLL